MKKAGITKHSLSRRLSYVLTGIVACTLLLFSAVYVISNASRAEQRLQEELNQTAKLAETSLASAVWQINPSSISDVLEAIFTEEEIAYTRVISDNEVLAVKSRPEFTREDFAFFEQSSQFMTKTVEIQKDEAVIGTFQFAMSREKIQQDLKDDIVNTAILSILVVLTVSITSMIITRHYILGPLSNLVNSTSLIASGALDDSIIGDSDMIRHQGEIGELARAFEHMRKSLQHLIGHIRNAGLLIQASSDAMFMAVSKLTVVLEQQSASVLETTSTMESITETSRRIAGNADAVVNMAEQTRTRSQKGVAMAEKTLEKMQDIHHTNTQVLHTVMELGTLSEKIGDVSQIINDIADRTKLIAFNAALEAGGTKDTLVGKRFNVVAFEIRRLADTIIESIQEIEETIQESQQGIRELVRSSDVTTAKISEGAEQTEMTNDWLREILQAAIQTTDEARQIAMSIQEQQLANEHILAALKEIADGSQEFVSAGNQVSESAKEMQRVAKELETLMSRFELGKEEA